MLMMYVMTLFALVGALVSQSREIDAGERSRELEFVYVAVRSIAPPRMLELAPAKWAMA